MTDQSGKVYGWRSLFAGIILGFVATYGLIILKTNIYPKPVTTKSIACIPKSTVCIGAPISAIDGLIGYRDGKVIGITDLICERGMIHYGLELVMPKDRKCKNNQYKIVITNERMFSDTITTYRIFARGNVILSIESDSYSGIESRAKIDL